MVYISIPEGWSFDSFNYDSDVFVNNSKGNIQVIPLQFLLKELLRTKKRRDHRLTLDLEQTHKAVITVYFRLPPESEDYFLQYLPYLNGKQKSNNVCVIQGNEVPRNKPIYKSGFLWFQHKQIQESLSAERHATLTQKSKEQRENRRHTGDSPLAT